ncbi:hypothetical protein BKA62DRAFT_706479 [Auriculariales sp. MPI-PUGE-AT-0066]|nr:hypothetical protein BKA62DRAFT_706479 [Auriculariales sp. MPI-PUGE-AT-0066]
MKYSVLLLFALPAAASWFGSDDKPEYSSWSSTQLKDWLNQRDIHVPTGYTTEQLQELVQANWNDGVTWSQEQYNTAQKAFADVRQSSFDTWDESRLRQFLLEQGVVAPADKKEELLLLANKQYIQFKNAASSYASQASATASSVYYGDRGAWEHATSSASSVIAQATEPVVRSLDDSKDYIYSTWTDSELRTYLQDKGVIKTDAELRRDQMLAQMRHGYAGVANPIWNAWSDSYLHEWLVSHGIIKSDYEKRRDDLIALMQDYYYSTGDYVWSTWDDTALKGWLVEHNVIKSNAEVKREKMIKLIQDNYNSAVDAINSASDTVYGGWQDSEMRQWLIDNGYMKSDAQAKRDELLALMQSKYNAAAARANEYTVWPDARLRAYLRNHGVTQAEIPKTRADLLHEVRIRWIQTKWESEGLYKRIKDTVSSTVGTAEERLSKVLDILSGAKHDYGAANAKATKRAKNEL